MEVLKFLKILLKETDPVTNPELQDSIRVVNGCGGNLVLYLLMHQTLFL